jgi:outer membrane protein TolC
MRTGLVLALLALAVPAHAQSAPAARAIALREAITLAVKQNRVLQAGDADLEIAVSNEIAASGIEDFEIDGKGSWTRQRSSPVEGSPFYQTALDNVHSEATAVQPLPYGGRLGLRLSNDFTRTVNRIDLGTGMVLDTTSDVWQPTVQITYFQPLLRGLGESVFRAQRRRTAAVTDVATATLENTLTSTVRDTIQAYWELVFQQKDLDIRRSALALAREQLRVTQARLDVGVGAPTDLAEVKQVIATREEDELLSQLTLEERALDLRQLAGMEISPTEIGLTATDEATPNPLDITTERALAAAYDHNGQLAIIRAQGRQAEIEVDVDQNGLLPQLDLTAAFGPQGNSDSFDGALDRLVHFKDYQGNIGVTLAAPVARHTAKGTIAAAKAQLHKVHIGESDLKAQIAVAVSRGVDLVKSTQKRLDTDAEAIQLAQVNLDAERARFDVGRSTNFDVLRRQDDLSQAQLRRVRAAADYMKAVAVLQSLTGELLPAYGVTIKPRGR